MHNFTAKNLPVNFTNYFVQNMHIHTYPTRISNDLRPAHFKYDLARNTVKRQGPILWNSLSSDLCKSNSVHIFKRKFKLYLLSYYK